MASTGEQSSEPGGPAEQPFARRQLDDVTAASGSYRGKHPVAYNYWSDMPSRLRGHQDLGAKMSRKGPLESWTWRRMSFAFITVFGVAPVVLVKCAESSDSSDSPPQDAGTSGSSQLTEQVLAATTANAPTRECNGRGTRRYCEGAHNEQDCPKGCNPWECTNQKSKDLGDKNHDIVMSGKYDFVYYDAYTSKVCVSYCWRRWDDMRCTTGKEDQARWVR